MIVVDKLHRRFGAFAAVDDVSFKVAHGELAALLGPSGSGKSTILRIVAGLDAADSGVVSINGVRSDHLDARDRGVGFVFQHYALFRHMNVGDNVAFGLRVQGVSRARTAERVRHLLAMTGLQGFENRYPAQLSGGQRQRVALARALAPEPRVLLLDEPFSAVDAKVREDLRRWLRKLHDDARVTTVFVTHDQDEAFSIADRVMIVHQGRLEQTGTPAEILDDPATEFVAQFVGETNVFDSVVLDHRAHVGTLQIGLDGHADGTRVRLVVRPYDLKFWQDDAGIATVQRVTPLGDRVKVEAAIDDGRSIIAQFPRRSSLLRGVEPGARIQVEVTRVRAYAVPGAQHAA